MVECESTWALTQTTSPSLKHNKDTSEADLRKKSLIYPASVFSWHTPSFVFQTVFFCSSWKMHYILLRQFLLELLMTSSWLNSKVTLPIWTILIYKLVLSLWMILPSFISRHRQMAPLTLQSNGFLLISLTGCLELNSWLHSSLWGEDDPTAVIVFVSDTQHYWSLMSSILFFREIPLEGDSSLPLKEDNWKNCHL